MFIFLSFLFYHIKSIDLKKLVYPLDYDKTQIIRETDFNILGLTFIKENMIRDSQLSYFLQNHDIQQDQLMKGQNKIKSQYQTQNFLYSVKNYEFYAKYIDEIFEFGLFCQDMIKKGDVLGQVTGELTFKLKGENYQYQYPSLFNGEQEIWLDSTLESNMFRFMNDKGNNSNCEIKFEPYQDQWILLAHAIKDIEEGEEITVNYGDDFWSNKIRDQKVYNHQHKYLNPFSQKSFQHSDFEKLGLTYLNQTRIEPYLNEIVINFNFQKSIEYVKEKDQIQIFLSQIKDQLDNLPDMDDIIEIKFINEDIGYGAFAKQDLKPNTVLGEYTGVMTSVIEDATYSWYLTDHYDQEHIKIYLNGLHEGNMLRFINDYSEQNNCYCVILPYYNKWTIFYITDIQINQGEELSVDYGLEYWNDRYRMEDFDKEDEFYFINKDL